jgi:3-methyladenine DNA glycosylase AlkD
MTGKELATYIEQFCIENAEIETALKYERYFKEGYQALGVKQSVLIPEVKKITQTYQPDTQIIHEAALPLLQKGIYEPIVMVILLFEKQKKHFTANNFEQIGEWFDNGIENWAHCDVICSKLTPLFLLNNIVSPEKMAQWLQSSRKYKRRAVPVTFIMLVKRQPQLIATILHLCQPLMADKERVVHQGMGWMLREAWKKSPEIVEKFLFEWKETAPRLIFQYATEKMSKAERMRFRRGK